MKSSVVGLAILLSILVLGVRAAGAEAVASENGAALEVTMSQLIEEAAANGVAFERKYKGKAFKITGLVQSVSQLPNDEILLVIAHNPEIVPLIAHLLPEEIDRAAALSSGQIVDLRCVGAKARTALDLLKCKIVPRTR